jgi:hypothetical protein
MGWLGSVADTLAINLAGERLITAPPEHIGG